MRQIQRETPPVKSGYCAGSLAGEKGGGPIRLGITGGLCAMSWWGASGVESWWHDGRIAEGGPMAAEEGVVGDESSDDRPFAFLDTNPITAKPRQRGLTEIRG